MSSSAAGDQSASSQATVESSVIETVQSLIVAFVLAMTFRGFVIEGFVIPTGSMAPTLLGQHLLMRSEHTGAMFQVDPRSNNFNRLADPMLGPDFAGSAVPQRPVQPRMGDRILVIKCLYPFMEPRRFDVVVFKNPTDPVGDTSNYIKRLIGLPNEQVWLADGDVFAKPHGADRFTIQRKPEHVQRAVWQMVHHSDFVPQDIDRLHEQTRRRYLGPPWTTSSSHWDLSGRAYVCDTAEPTTLEWDNDRRALDDWTPYNMLAGTPELFPVGDVRVSAGIVAPEPGFASTLEIEVRGHIFQFEIDHDSASMRMYPIDQPQAVVERSAAIELPEPGQVFNVEFWHVDQAMHLFIDGERVMPPLEYDWSPRERLANATGLTFDDDEDFDRRLDRDASQPRIRWHFRGSPVTLHRVRVDRDLHYRTDSLGRQQLNTPTIFGPAFGTHPTENAAILGPDQFMMCGDNSQMSLDSRLWGRPHPLVALQIDDTPFVVHRKLLLGKAWVVYFPAMYPIGGNRGTPVIPDFGRLRFIR